MAVTIDVIKDLSAETKLPAFKTRSALNNLAKIIGAELKDGSKVELSDLGSFKLTRLPERKLETNAGEQKQTFIIPAAIVPDFELASQAKEGLAEKIKNGQTDEQSPSFLFTRKSNIRFVELAGKEIPKNILGLIPENLARKFQAIPFALEGNTLAVAMVDPENEEAFNAIRKFSGRMVEPYLTTQDNVSTVLDQYSGLQNELKELVDSGDAEGVDEVKEEEVTQVADEEITETSPAAKIVSSLLKRAVREKASDVHIEPSEEDVQVRFRIDGVLRRVLSLPKEVQAAVISRVKILSNLKIDENRLPQDGRIQLLLDGKKVDFRISTLPTVNGEKVVARVLDRSGGVLNFQQLGMQGRSYQIMEDNITKSHGMTLVTGPTGSGKSTTLYAIIGRIKDVAVNIITMEDPVEYRMSGVNQSQVNSRIGFNFASGLRSILRQDPDVIMVGEIRDRETADIAINAALTGHIVLSSLHTNDAAGALPRLLDMEIEPFLITSSTNLIIAQRLCRKICSQCIQETTLKPEDVDLIAKEIEALNEPEKGQAKAKNKFYQGKGCPACGNSGYKGRVGIFEVLPVTESIKQLTLKRATSSELTEQAKKEGLITMKQDGILKALDGQTTIEEVWRVTKD